MFDAEAHYDQWQEVLAARYFGARLAGLPAILFVNDTIASELKAEFALRVGIVETVSALISPDAPTQAYARIGRHADRAGNSAGSDVPPHVLPLLAVTVMTATRMMRDNEFTSANFFDRMAQLLAGPDYHASYRASLSSSFPQVVSYWERLDRWMRSNNGQFGVSTIAATHAHSWIGYPLSQAIMRDSDRAVLTQFFAKAGLERGIITSGKQLARQIERWGRGKSLFSRQFQDALADPSARDQLIAMLEDQAAAWDGIVLESPRLRLSSLRLRADNAMKLSWIAEVVPHVATTAVRRGNVVFDLISSDGDRYYLGLENLPFDSTALSDGIRLLGEGVAAVFRPAPVLPFRRDRYLGGWVSTDNAEPYEEHRLLVRDSAVPEIDRLLVGVSSVRKVSAERIGIPGWTVYDGVVLDDPQALAASGSATARLLRPSPASRPLLTGGLKIAAMLGSANYLLGGEPDLVLPLDDDEHRTVEVVLDGGRRQEVRPSVFPFPLSFVRDLSEGEHTVEVEGAILRFNLWQSAEKLPPRVPDVVGIVIGGGDAGLAQVASDAPLLYGANAPETELPWVVLASRRADRVIVIDHCGNANTYSCPEAPSWAGRMGDAMGGRFFEVKVPRPGGWLLEQLRNGWRVTAVNPAPLEIGGRRLRSWSAAVLEAASGSNDPLWAKYVLAAKAAAP